MFQNRSASAESAHANAEASVSGHQFDSGGTSIEFVGRKRKFFKSERKWGLESFCEIGMILRLRHNLELSEKFNVELKLDLEIFCPKRREKRNRTYKIFVQKAKGRKGVGLETLCPSKKGEGE